ncbi:MAG: hypothetical protein AAFV43_12630 [Planctomycetota bacterium]
MPSSGAHAEHLLLEAEFVVTRGDFDADFAEETALELPTVGRRIELSFDLRHAMADTVTYTDGSTVFATSVWRFELGLVDSDRRGLLGDVEYALNLPIFTLPIGRAPRGVVATLAPDAHIDVEYGPVLLQPWGWDAGFEFDGLPFAGLASDDDLSFYDLETFDLTPQVGDGVSGGFTLSTRTDWPFGPIEIVAELTSLRFVTVESEFVAGDFNTDGRVSSADLNLLLNHWGSFKYLRDWTGSRVTQIDNGELNVLLRDWGTRATALVPEPAAQAVLVLGLLASRPRRR